MPFKMRILSNKMYHKACGYYCISIFFSAARGNVLQSSIKKRNLQWVLVAPRGIHDKIGKLFGQRKKNLHSGYLSHSACATLIICRVSPSVVTVAIPATLPCLHRTYAICIDSCGRSPIQHQLLVLKLVCSPFHTKVTKCKPLPRRKTCRQAAQQLD